MDFDALLLVVAIFFLRALNNAMGTFRVIMITYGRRRLSFLLAFCESIIFAFTASQVITDLGNIPNLFSYASGFAVGGYVGMVIEDRFMTGYMTLTIIVANGGREIATILRNAGYGVTETAGEGAQGNVSMLRSVILRQQVGHVRELVQTHTPQAFMTLEEARAVHQGWMREKTRRHK